jgi:hypothetical protein
MSTDGDSPLTASLRRYLVDIRPSDDLDALPAARREALAFGGRFLDWAEECDPEFYAAWLAFPEDVAGAFIAETVELRRREAEAGVT